MTPAEIATEVADITRVEEWPLYPLLPMKRYAESGGWPEAGLMHAGDLTTVYLVNIWALGEMSEADRAKIEKQTFESVTALVEAGWIGD